MKDLLKWIKVDPANLPQSKVLASNGSNLMVGWLSRDRQNSMFGGEVKCEDENDNRIRAEWYILAEDLLKSIQ